jgi:catechol 2,3-dioxygenase-like lactoylglutathione lyase family enzyme
MFNGAHVIIYSQDAEADRRFFRDVLELPHVDDGGGWLIFRLPPGELGIHPSDENDKHALYLMCEDLDGTMKKLKARGAACEPLSTAGWGRVSQLRLPGGGMLAFYEPRHARP